MADGAATYVLDMGEPVRIVDLVAELRAAAQRPRRRHPLHRAAPGREARTRSSSATTRQRVPTAHPRITRAAPAAAGAGFRARAPRAVRRGRRTTGADEVREHLRALVPEYCAAEPAGPARSRCSPALPRRLLSDETDSMDHRMPPPPRGASRVTRRHRTARGVRRQRLLPADPAPLASLGSAGRRGADLAAPPVVLPDFHHKSKMELPSSVAVATSGTVRPDLTGSSVNCGMALIALDCDRPDDRAVDAFMRAVRERYPYPTRGRRDLTAPRWSRAAADGAEFAVERWDAPARGPRAHRGGRPDRPRALRRGRPAASRAARPRAGSSPGYRFGTVGPVQPLRGAAAGRGGARPRARRRVLGVRRGSADPAVPRRRRGADRRDRPAVLPAQGLPAADQGGQRRAQAAGSTCAPPVRTQQLRERLRLYFTDGCAPLALDSDEGQRLMLANAAAMNYGFAFRMATYAALRRLAAECFGGAHRPAGRRLPAQQHLRGGRRRQRGGRAPAQLLPCLPGGADAARHHVRDAPARQCCCPARTARRATSRSPATARRGSLHSACHGAGTVVSDLVERGASRAPTRCTADTSLPVRRRCSAPTPGTSTTAASTPLCDVLVRNGLVTPVAPDAAHRGPPLTVHERERS